ncbi:MAG: tRNA uridine-5-carboxymethylaminomethyl(34) synthesis GTPase MnmE [Thermodesulfovibrio sp.]|uniref:tRNA uridine-5-carboxymethylaminomethyl(34) synthesis GTPase MnmE n=1 Tax=unclassified Thermodesulfovibrio TaxID=2645936 RepID=UPI000856B9E4|nr:MULTISPECIES: tRNA uridine-5-carboxymethylaminomethyl(34) synthesis GTPase MnmE [unclassified Thermodesulfovibrio]MDI1471578.1 tRNA uridine-5-carboxymethylaminomethyl(34) synthesis GTPase MnmE [Thermodesulfovibrio sp. 1176]MDI6715113.1 tRNA uridine-5-carboxymethylaminomethyl(34) synthesis GTPase MnmE [Thermodesulfovibrio sp.]ODA44693.1 GTPase and tRNA-U34 5-formylation enzyme TrmE [Thermodesulfovibrio sp. N1]
MIFSEFDTIAAISTPLGEGGIGIIRLSGKEAISIVNKIFKSPKGVNLSDVKTHTIHYGFIVDPLTRQRIDEVLVTVMRAPNTYTREDVVEINCHGGYLTLKRILELVLSQGARLAEPGEFTKRAFLRGRIDLSQAESVIDLIRAKTDQAQKIALEHLSGRLSEKINELRDSLMRVCAHVEAYIDFPEEDIDGLTEEEITQQINCLKEEIKKLIEGYEEGKIYREGLTTAIVGKPNVGKSSLLNALLMKDRAIVTEIPGTTRDIIEEYVNIKGIPLKIVDTAGIREAHDLVEAEGIKRSLKAVESAELVLLVIDSSRSIDRLDEEIINKVIHKKVIVVINKKDIKSTEFHLPESLKDKPAVEISALNAEGIEDLKELIFNTTISGKYEKEGIVVTKLRHKLSLEKAFESLNNAYESFKKREPLEITAMFLREALNFLGQIVGVVTTEEILNLIFSEFCIGK